MTLSDVLVPEFDAELAITRRALERVPDGRSSWKPHPKSMTLGRLATLIAELPNWAVNALTLDQFDFAPPGGPPMQFPTLEPIARVLELLDRNAHAARTALLATTDAAFANPWRLLFGGRVISTEPRMTVYRRALNHLVHHRGQLTVYLRLNDAKVPSIYGPTADEPAF
ncbi:MAG TPA: DinB family protein [Gemmatimonadales bacterium]|nr:DinB family protein [Gemmatimonadales bacterium]